CHVALTPLHEQRWLLPSDHRVLSFTIFQLHSDDVGCWTTSPYLQGFLARARQHHAESFLTGHASYKPVLLIGCKVTLKFIRPWLPVLNATNSCALQHRHNCANDFSNSILPRP